MARRILHLCVGFVAFLSSPALASRAEMEGRALPPLLAVDAANLRILPATAGRLPALVLADVSTSSGQPVGFHEGNDSFALALVGTRTKFGYFLDGQEHHLLLAGRAWAVNLGFSDTFNETSSLYTSEDSVSYSARLRKSKTSRTAVRLGVGWRTTIGEERILEFGVGGSYVDSEVRSREVVRDDAEFAEAEKAFMSDPGVGFDVTVRSVSSEPGLLIGFHFAYEELNPARDQTFRLDSNRHAAHLQVGWRLENPPIDDLVLGVRSFWGESSSAVAGSGSIRTREVTEYSARAFASAEHEVLDGLIARGGIEGAASFHEDRRVTDDLGTTGRAYTYDDTYDQGSFNSAGFFLGGGWTWKSLILDFRINQGISLDYPVVRWSATLVL